jgi:hypothetical protein
MRRAILTILALPPNTSNVRLKQILTKALLQAIALLDAGEPLVEINAT